MKDKKESVDDNKHRLVALEDAGHGEYKIFTSVVLFVREAREVGVHDQESIQYFSCAWNFCRIAHESLEVYPKDVVLEGETDPVAYLRSALEAQMKLYQVTDIEKVARFFPMCRTLAFRRTIHWSSRFQAWIDTGGRAYNVLSREPDSRA